MGELRDKIKNLCHAIHEQEPPEEQEYMYDFVRDKISRFPQYFKSVIDMTSAADMAQNASDKKAAQEYVHKLDVARREKHMLATDAVNILNRTAVMYGLDKIFKCDHILDSQSKDDRDLAAEMTYKLCTDYFIPGLNKRLIADIDNKSYSEIESELYAISKTKSNFDKDITVKKFDRVFAVERE